jgi:hypothetical protein
MLSYGWNKKCIKKSLYESIAQMVWIGIWHMSISCVVIVLS